MPRRSRPSLAVFRHGSCLRVLKKRQRRKCEWAADPVRRLDADLAAWVELSAQRRELAAAAEAQGLDWEVQALGQELPVDYAGLSLHRRCAAAIEKHSLHRGVLAWDPPASPALGPISSWREFEAMTGMPGGGYGAVVTDCLSFPLTAAHAARRAGVAANADGVLTLLVLGAEVGSELSGPSEGSFLLAPHWSLLLGGHGLGARQLNVLFVGPECPAGFKGEPITSSHGSENGELHTCAVRGAWHDPAVQAAIPARFREVDLAIAFNSGLAEHASSWVPTLWSLGAAGVPFACTSYHAAEAELDVRTLVVRAGLHERGLRAIMAPNKLASKLPHLDGIFPGVVYRANAFLTVWSLEPGPGGSA